MCIRDRVETADAEIAAAGSDLKYEVGTMIEIPRAALTADEIAKEADFFCFGTNDLTQMTFGFSRDDAGKFLDAYYDAKIFENDPFAKLDQTGAVSYTHLDVYKRQVYDRGNAVRTGRIQCRSNADDQGCGGYVERLSLIHI